MSCALNTKRHCLASKRGSLCGHIGIITCQTELTNCSELQCDTPIERGPSSIFISSKASSDSTHSDPQVVEMPDMKTTSHRYYHGRRFEDTSPADQLTMCESCLHEADRPRLSASRVRQSGCFSVRLLAMLVLWCSLLLFSTCAAEIERIYKPKFNVTQLLNAHFPHLISDDVYADPCKGREFIRFITRKGLKCL
jgi:hypothetical protein